MLRTCRNQRAIDFVYIIVLPLDELTTTRKFRRKNFNFNKGTSAIKADRMIFKDSSRLYDLFYHNNRHYNKEDKKRYEKIIEVTGFHRKNQLRIEIN